MSVVEPAAIDCRSVPSRSRILTEVSFLADEELLGSQSSHAAVLGGKTIGWFGSWVLTVNNITGPGMMHIAAIFQQAGLIVPVLVFFMVCFVSAAAATLLCDALARLPGNRQLDIRFEYSDLFRHYFGSRSFIASQIVFFCAIFSQTAASIVSTAQSVDGLIVLMAGKTWAWEPFYGSESWIGRIVEWDPLRYCGNVGEKSSQCVPFSILPSGTAPAIGIVLTAGYITTCALLAPLCRMNLDDNIKFQIGSFVVLVVLSLEFMIDMGVRQGFNPSLVPCFGSSYSNMLGTIMFNFAFCPTIPAWLNEKRREVSTGPVIWSAALSSTLLYLLLGLCGAMAYPHASSNLLETLSAGDTPVVTKVCAFLFGSLVLGLGVPVFCIIMRYNLVVGGVCGNVTATFFGVALPWMTSWLLYQGRASAVFINFSGTILISLVGFVLPLVVALAASGVVLRPEDGCRMKQLLQAMIARSSLSSTVCAILPCRWLHYQRRYVSILLLVCVPMVLAGVYFELAGL